MREGTRIAFGKATDEPWEIVDDSPPVPMAVPLAGGPPVLAEGDMIALPSVDDPQATLYRDVRDGWVLERPDEPASRIPHLRSFEVAGTRWRFCCPNETYSTTFSLATHDLTLANVGAHFLVSSNEEHVTLRLQCGSRTIDMGSRAHNYLLLTLARARIKDEQAGHPDPVCGWVEHDEFAHDPSLAPPQLHLHVFRIRKHFASFGMVDAARVIERRPRQRQLRIGIRNLTITRH